MQHFAFSSAADGKSIRSDKGRPIYVAMESQTPRVEDTKKKKTNKDAEDARVVNVEKAKQNKNERKIEDGLLMVVATRIYGKKVRALIDSGATRCFVTPAYVTACGLKGTPRDIFLELGNGKKYLSKGYVSDVPVVTAGLTVKIGLTVTALLRCGPRARNELAPVS